MLKRDGVGVERKGKQEEVEERLAMEKEKWRRADKGPWNKTRVLNGKIGQGREKTNEKIRDSFPESPLTSQCRSCWDPGQASALPGLHFFPPPPSLPGLSGEGQGQDNWTEVHIPLWPG